MCSVGSTRARAQGRDINQTTQYPEQPQPFRAWSFRFSVPPYSPVKGGDVITLQKMYQVRARVSFVS